MIANGERLLILRSDNVWNREEVLKKRSSCRGNTFWKDKILNGVQIYITDFDKVNLLELQFYFLQVHHNLYPQINPFTLATTTRMKMFDLVLGTDKVRTKFSKRFRVEDIKKFLRKDIDWFRKLSRRYYLYN